MTIEDVIAEGDKVVVRLTSHGRHAGEFMGMPASGKEYDISEIHIFRIADGKVAEHWRDADMLGMMRQLGALPHGGGLLTTDWLALRTTTSVASLLPLSSRDRCSRPDASS